MVLRAFVPIAILGCLAVVGGCATDGRPLPSDARARNTGAFPTFGPTPVAAARQLPQSDVNSAVGRLERAERQALNQPVPMADSIDDLDAAGASAASAPPPMMVEERIARLGEAGRRARAGTATSADERARLARIGRTHADETLRRIRESGGRGAATDAEECADGTRADGSPCPE